MCLEELANVSGVPPTRLQTLLTALVASKCLRQSGGCYQNSPNVQKFMVSSSKGYYGDYLTLGGGGRELILSYFHFDSKA